MAKLAKSYDAKVCEEKWYQTWIDEGCFHADAADGGDPFCIMIPPPNVTGILHMGHALNNTIQDVLIRVARMEGKNAVWIPGTDHAGIATQTKVERLIREETGQTKHDLGREAFVNKIWDFRNESGEIILNQLKKLGASKANDVRKSVKPSNRSLRIDSDDEVTDGNDVKLQQAPSCDEGLDTIEVQIVQKKWDLDNLSIETTKLQKLKKALQASVMRQKQRRLVAIAGVLPLAKRGGGV